MEPTGFITRWTVSGDAAARTISLPLVPTRAEGPLSYDCTVDWGDGSTPSTITSYDDPARVHTYTANGTYDVEIRGTCEGWSFNFYGDRLKIVAIVDWGFPETFGGFKFLSGGFYGCNNLTSIAPGPILASGSGIGVQGFTSTFSGCRVSTISADLFILHPNVTHHAFDSTFNGCSLLTSIPAGLFDCATLADNYAFNACFANCTSLTSVPEHLFDQCSAVAAYGFANCFAKCTSLTEIPAGLFDYCTQVSSNGFNSTFYGCSSLIAIPTDLFINNREVSSNGFQQTFRECSALTAIPTDLFRYCTKVTTSAFRSCFYYCTSLQNIPADLFRYCTLASDYAFRSTFNGCFALENVPADLFRYCTTAIVGAFQYTFLNCARLKLNKNLFYADGEESTRFHNQNVDFESCFERQAFLGVQGTAPNLWDCDFGTGVPVKFSCYGEAGNNSSSISNYDDIPVAWR